jgi:hypothetical protein
MSPSKPRPPHGPASPAKDKLLASAPVGAQIEAVRASVALARARVEAARAALSQAELQLSYTIVTAPAAGLLSKVAANPGELIDAKQAIAEIVPGEMYVVANYKETQLADISPGKSADISLDACPGRPFHGTVASLSGATGARFSLLPPPTTSPATSSKSFSASRCASRSTTHPPTYRARGAVHRGDRPPRLERGGPRDPPTSRRSPKSAYSIRAAVFVARRYTSTDAVGRRRAVSSKVRVIRSKIASSSQNRASRRHRGKHSAKTRSNRAPLIVIRSRWFDPAAVDLEHRAQCEKQ